MKSTYQVTGMTCGGCVRALVGALTHAGIAVSAADVSLAAGTVAVDEKVELAKLRAAVEGAGFALGARG